MKNNNINKFYWNIAGSVIISIFFVYLTIYFFGTEVFPIWKKNTSGIIEFLLIITLALKCFSFVGWYLVLTKHRGKMKFNDVLVNTYTLTIVFCIVMLDVLLYPNYNLGVLYTMIVPFGWFLNSDNGTIKASLWSIFLCVISYFFIKNHGDFEVFFLNRLSSLIVIVMVGVFLKYFKLNKNKLNETNIVLSQKIIETESKSKEMEQFVYTVSHDLKEPLRSASVMLDILSNSNDSHIVEDDLELLETVKASTAKMGKSIDAILDYSKLGQSFSLDTVDINKVLNDVIFDIEPKLMTADVKIDKQELGFLNVYLSDFRILMTNLINNALFYRKYTEDCEISISREDEGNYAIFSVKDNGIGIVKENHERIFNIFQSLKSDSNKKGIGLARCRKIVERHKGDITVNSRKNNGSTFIFKIAKDLK